MKNLKNISSFVKNVGKLFLNIKKIQVSSYKNKKNNSPAICI